MDLDAIARKIHPSYDSLPVRARGYYREYIKKVLEAAGVPQMEKVCEAAKVQLADCAECDIEDCCAIDCFETLCDALAERGG